MFNSDNDYENSYNSQRAADKKGSIVHSQGEKTSLAVSGAAR